MKVLLINGSPHKNGATNRILEEVAKALNEEKIETEIIQVGSEQISGCLACGYCYKNAKCVKNDIVNVVSKKFEEADGLVIGSPVYYASANGTLISFLDRLFYSSHFDKTMKVGASVVNCRRGGNASTFDELNKYFTICGMPVVSSYYWNETHGNTKEEVEQDLEGLDTMKALGHNMAFLIKSINLGKEKYGIPKREKITRTNFIR